MEVNARQILATATSLQKTRRRSGCFFALLENCSCLFPLISDVDTSCLAETSSGPPEDTSWTTF